MEMNEKPKNPFKPGSFIYNLFELDCPDKTTDEIAKEFGKTPRQVTYTLWKIYDQTGYRVPHVDGRTVMWKNRREKLIGACENG